MTSLHLLLFILGSCNSVLQKPKSHWLPLNHDYDHDYDKLTPEEHRPKILTKTGIFRAVQGDEITLPCDVIRLGKHSVIWHKEDTILWVLQGDPEGLQSVVRDDRFGSNGTDLVIGNVTIDDEAVYSCEVSSDHLIQVSQQLIVSVPPSATPRDGDGFVQDREGATVELLCRVSGRPRPDVTWEREDGKHLTGSASDTNYTITNVHRSDAGIYICIASNGVGQPAYAYIILDVQYAPTVQALRDTVHTGVNYDASLTCVVDASPFPRVDWFRESAPVNPMRLYKGIDKDNKFSLIFDHVIRKDFGWYSCNASNFFGNDSAVMELTGRPLQPNITSPSVGNFPNHYTLTWEVKSYAQVTQYVLLLRNYTEYDDGWINITVPGVAASSMYHSQRYLLRDISSGSPLEAKVQAINEFGESEWSQSFVFQTFDPGDGTSVSSHEDNFLLEVPAEELENPEFKIDLQTGIVSAYDPELPAVEEHLDNSVSNSTIPILFSSQRSSSNVSSSVTSTVSSVERKAQIIAIITVVSLSAFFS